MSVKRRPTRLVSRTTGSLLLILGLPGGVACDGGGCTEAGCESTVIMTFPDIKIGRQGRHVEAMMCLDGECREAQGRVTWGHDVTDADYSMSIGVTPPRPGREVRDGVDITWFLSNGDYDEVTPHELSVEVQAGGTEYASEQSVRLTENQPNGSGCPPTCWSAQVDSN